MAYIEILAPNLLDAVRHAGSNRDTIALRIAGRLSLADCIARPDAGFDAAVLSLFGLNEGSHGAPALAGVTAAYDFDLDAAPADLLRADPVHLRADPNHLILFDAELVGLDDDEATGLIALLNQSFANEGITFKRGRSPARWYVSVPNIKATTTRSPRSLRGQAIEPYLNDLRQTGQLNRIVTETQMLLHEAPVNAVRESAGKAPINSVWFWGLGALPVRPAAPLGTVIGDEDLVAACARYCGVRHHREVQGVSAGTFETPGSFAIVYELEPLAQGLEHFERNVWVPACAALHQGRFDELRLSTRDTAFALTRRQRWQFWRRLRPLKSVLEGGAGPPGFAP